MDPTAMKFLAASLAVGLTGLGAGIAEKEIGAAAVGAITENENLFGKALILTVIPEVIVLLGFVIAVRILG